MGGGWAEQRPIGRGPELVDVDANGGFTREELMERSVERTRLRAEMLSAPAAAHVHGDGDGKVAPDDIHYKYLVELDIGRKSPVRFLAVPDTGSDLVWTKKCSTSLTYVSCSHSQCSSCLGKVCNFKRKFGHGAKTATGLIVNEALTLSRRKNTDDTSGTDDETNHIYDVTIGCAHYEENLLPESADGIVGLNRGPMSLVQQLSLTNFSYCFSDKQVRGRLWLGDGYSLDQLSAGPYWHRLQTTPLVDVEWTEAAQRETVVDAPNMYYVQLEGISIGKNFTYQSLPKESFNLRSKKDKDKGVMFLDSGCSHTKLEKGVFEALLELLAHQHLGAEVKPEEKPEDHKESTCFRTSGEKPEMALYFHGVQMHLPWANYMDEVAGKSLFCLDIRVDSEMSILGNFQQQNTYMLYNLTKGNERLSFVQDFNCHTSQ